MYICIRSCRAFIIHIISETGREQVWAERHGLVVFLRKLCFGPCGRRAHAGNWVWVDVWPRNFREGHLQRRYELVWEEARGRQVIPVEALHPQL